MAMERLLFAFEIDTENKGERHTAKLLKDLVENNKTLTFYPYYDEGMEIMIVKFPADDKNAEYTKDLFKKLSAVKSGLIIHPSSFKDISEYDMNKDIESFIGKIEAVKESAMNVFNMANSIIGRDINKEVSGKAPETYADNTSEADDAVFEALMEEIAVPADNPDNNPFDESSENFDNEENTEYEDEADDDIYIAEIPEEPDAAYIEEIPESDDEGLDMGLTDVITENSKLYSDKYDILMPWDEYDSESVDSLKRIKAETGYDSMQDQFLEVLWKNRTDTPFKSYHDYAAKYPEMEAVDTPKFWTKSYFDFCEKHNVYSDISRQFPDGIITFDSFIRAKLNRDIPSEDMIRNKINSLY